VRAASGREREREREREGGREGGRERALATVSPPAQTNKSARTHELMRQGRRRPRCTRHREEEDACHMRRRIHVIGFTAVHSSPGVLLSTAAADIARMRSPAVSCLAI
jgi:hypothetical protein